MTKIFEEFSYLRILIYNQFERLKFCNMTVFTNINYCRILENNRLNETWPKMD